MWRSVPSTSLLERVGEVGERGAVVSAARGEQRGLVDEVGEVGADHARGRGCERGQVDISASGTLRVWTARICWRPSWSGALTTTRRSKRPARRSAVSSTSGRLVAATTMTPFGAREAVHLGEDLVEGLLALVVAAE